MSTKILFFLNFLIPLPHFGQLSGGALWWWFPELIFFWRTSSLLHPYFISSCHGGALWWWIPELIFFALFHPYSLLYPYFISSRQCGALWWWIPELFFSRTFPSLLPCNENLSSTKMLPPNDLHQNIFFFNFICVSLSLIANDWWGPLVVTSGTIYSHTFRASRPLSPNTSLPHCTPWRPFPRPPNGVHQINFTKIFLPSMKHVILLLNSLHKVPNK